MSEKIIMATTMLAEKVKSGGLTIATAESLTGGGIATSLTAFAGSSQWFIGAIVTYNNEMKHRLLDIPNEILSVHGAVSREVVSLMTAAVLRLTGADMAVAVSGIAGPEGGTALNPVGTVWIAWQNKEQSARTRKYLFAGDRAAVREQTIEKAIIGLVYTHTT